MAFNINNLSFYQHITNCNQHNLKNYVPWKFKNQQIGWIKKSFTQQLYAWPKVFLVKNQSVNLLLTNHSQLEITNSLTPIINQLVSQKAIRNFHNEPFPVVTNDRKNPVCIIDRSSAATFGIKAFGQHLNGYVIKNKQYYLWVAKRAGGKMTYPGKLDHLVAGGLPYGISLQNNLQKECMEEAGINTSLANKAKSVGTVTYTSESNEGIKPDTLYVYDLQLPLDFKPTPVDGEVESFELMPINTVINIVATTNKFKGNCNLVLIDFFIRHGFINGDHPEYLKLVKGLHQ